MSRLIGGGRLLRFGRLQHGLGGERQFLRHEVGDHVGPPPHVLPGLVVVVRAVDLQLKPLSINVRQTFRSGPYARGVMYKARAVRPPRSAPHGPVDVGPVRRLTFKLRLTISVRTDYGRRTKFGSVQIGQTRGPRAVLVHRARGRTYIVEKTFYSAALWYFVYCFYGTPLGPVPIKAKFVHDFLNTDRVLYYNHNTFLIV